jgi:hypothetical protein
MCITFRPDINLITSTRRYASELLENVIGDAEATSRAALTIHELLENTLKYSKDGVASLEISIDTEGAARLVRIAASNRATPDRLAEIRERIDALQRLDDPMEVYVRMLVQAAAREHGSGLGLARIRVEAEMDLAYVIDGDRLTITAVAPIGARDELRVDDFDRVVDGGAA